jgi:hypothetical protein
MECLGLYVLLLPPAVAVAPRTTAAANPATASTMAMLLALPFNVFPLPGWIGPRLNLKEGDIRLNI